MKWEAISLAAVGAAGAAELKNQVVDDYGDIQERRVSVASLPSYSFEYRTYDGSDNNEVYSYWGQAHTYYIRKVEHDYSEHNGSSISGENRPGPREISNRVMDQDSSIPNCLADGTHATDFLWQWGQFIDHDIDETGHASPREGIDIDIPSGDQYFDPDMTGNKTMSMSRSDWELDAHGVRQQINRISAFIDASAVYGCEKERIDFIRTNSGDGKLKMSGQNLNMLPYNWEGQDNAGGSGSNLFFAGDVRANEQAGLLAMHTLFAREHNYWAGSIRTAVESEAAALGLQHTLEERDEFIFQRARMIVAAEMQIITYNEFLPILLGENALPTYTGYKPDINPSIANEFVAASYRVGHTMLSNELKRLDANLSPIPDGHIKLKDVFFSPAMIENYGIEPYLRGMANQPAQAIDAKLVHAVRNCLFPKEGGFDLAALNIQRGRDHGIPGYNAVRWAYFLEPVESFDDIPRIDAATKQALKGVYGEQNVNDCDLWVCSLAERPLEGGMVGPTLRAVLVDQFTRLRDGDRFWYENHLSKHMKDYILDRATLSKIIKRNTDIGDELQHNAFIMTHTTTL